MRNYKGIIEIDLADVWVFILKNKPIINDKDNPCTIEWDEFNWDILVVRDLKDTTQYEIDGTDFWGWVADNYVPSRWDMILFSKPKYKESDQLLVLNFVASDTVQPTVVEDVK